ncbi:MAG: ABC transporter ATP-binding protein [Clostridiales bacterium]|nr:ABC transporter ATP-binding protein [Clostridiales bacterium]
MRLHIDELVKNYKDKAVLKGASFTFEQGRIYGLLGRNGAGKTTLFNCMARYLEFDSGRIGLDLDETADSPAAFFEGGGKSDYDESDIGFVFTQPHLPEFLTGREFIKFFIEINGAKVVDPLDIDEYFRLVSFDPEDGDRLIKEYSHGMMNKLQMLISLYILKPPVILLDEPLTSFDVVAALEVKNMIKAIKKDHIIIFSTHILELAQDLCDEIVVLHNGLLRHIPAKSIHSPQFESDIITILSDKDPGGSETAAIDLIAVEPEQAKFDPLTAERTDTDKKNISMDSEGQ